MFGKHKEHKRRHGGGLFGLIRIFLSLIMLGVLLLGVYQAYKSFSGYDPLKLSPQSLADNLLSSDSLYQLVTGLLTFSPKSTIQDVLKDNPSSSSPLGTQKPRPNSPVLYKFAVIGDPHKDMVNLKRALDQAKLNGAKFIIGIGDFSDVGTLDELRNVKLQFDTLGLPYYVVPGDHDMWESRNKNLKPESNFTSVFGTPYQSFSYANTRLLLIFNVDNYLGLDGVQLKWMEDELARLESEGSPAAFAVVGTPLYHPSSDHVMGKENVKLRNQADHLIDLFSKKGIDAVFAGDTHFASKYKEPKTDLEMYTVGAVTSERNAQNPRYQMVTIYEDGSYTVDDTEVK